MADEDEDVAGLGAPEDATDGDPADETHDYSALAKLGLPSHTAPLSLPKRGEKDFESHATDQQLTTLEASRLAMHNVLSWGRTHTAKNHVVATYHPEPNMASVAKAKTSQFLTMGKAKGGKEWLLPEEALFLIERGTLDCRWPVPQGEEGEGVPMSLQAAYAAFVGSEAGIGGKLTLDMYTVYAGLKRSGYVVFRHGSWDDERAALAPRSATPHDKHTRANPGLLSRFFAGIWRRISQPTHTISAASLAHGPLVRPGLYRSYADIYRLLQTYPIRTHSPTEPPAFLLPPSAANPYRLHFDVWKTSGSARFRKSDRPPPHFRVCVISARETSVPTAAQLHDLLATVPDEDKEEEEQTHMMKRLKQGKRGVVLAVVDAGVPSYIRVAHADFGAEKVYESQGGRGAKGGGRGARGARGRGRGRGR